MVPGPQHLLTSAIDVGRMSCGPLRSSLSSGVRLQSGCKPGGWGAVEFARRPVVLLRPPVVRVADTRLNFMQGGARSSGPQGVQEFDRAQPVHGLIVRAAELRVAAPRTSFCTAVTAADHVERQLDQRVEVGERLVDDA
jgi:hypothetical protein